MGVVFFFDTYAIIEVIKGSEKYSKYKISDMVTSRLNLMEVYYWLLSNFDKAKSDFFFETMRRFCADIDDDVVKDAAVLKKENKSKGLSYIDCIGYVLAKRNGLKFLTGDKQFEGLDNVEFVK